MRALPANWTRESDGDLVVARGDQNLEVWDGLGYFTDAGVPAPSTAVTLLGSGVGSITGDLVGYVRYLDSQGRTSAMAPASDLYTIESIKKTITGATWADPIVVTAVGHGLSTGDIVEIEGVRGNYGANGSWTVTYVTDDTFSLDDSVGTGNYTGGGTIRRGVSQINYESIEIATDPRASRVQLLRNKDGNANVVYVDLDTNVADDDFGVADTDASSSKLENGLGSAVPLLDSRGNDLNLNRHGEPPAWKRHVTSHNNRLWLSVDAPYKCGAVDVTNGSTTVTGIQTGWVAEHENWRLYVQGDANTYYEIDSIDTAAQTMVLGSAYGGASDPFAKYQLRKVTQDRFGVDRNESLTVWYSEPDLPYSFNTVDKGLTFEEDPEAGALVGTLSYRGFIYMLFEHRIYRFAYSTEPGEDGQPFFDHWRGSVNGRTWALSEDAVYLLDRQGIYVFGGNFSEDISLPLQSLWDVLGTKRKINWASSDYFHCTYDPVDQIVRWFVCLDSSYYPKHAIAYNYRHKRWWLEEFPFPITSSCIGVLEGRRQMFVGSTARRVFAYGTANLDGVDANEGTLRGTVTSADPRSVTDTSATFSDSVNGLPLRIVEGTGRGQERIIVAVEATKLTVRDDWFTQPDTTSVYQIGGVHYTYKTGVYDLQNTDFHSKRGVEIEYYPTTEDSRLEFRLFRDDLDFGILVADEQRISETTNGITTTRGAADVAVDTTRVNGFVQHHYDNSGGMRTDAPNQIQVELQGVTNGERHRITRIGLVGAER